MHHSDKKPDPGSVDHEQRLRRTLVGTCCGSLVILGAFHAQATPLSTPWGVEFKSCVHSASDRDVDRAKQAYANGQTAFSEGDYDKSIQLWLEAYRLDCQAHALLLNLATAFELAERVEDAMAALRHYNAQVVDSAYVAPNGKRLVRLKERAQAQRRQASKNEQRPTAATPARATRSPPEHKASTRAIWMLEAGGVAGLLAGGLLFLEGRISAAQASETCGDRSSCSDFSAVIEGERARARANAGGWLMLGGALLGTAGATWQVFASEQAAGPTRVTLALTRRNQVTLGVQGSF